VEVIGVLCVPPGGSTVQLHDSLGSRRPCAYSEASFSSENGDSGCEAYYRRAAFWCAFFSGQKDSMQGIFIKKCFPFTVGGVFHVKRFTTESRNSLKDVRNWVLPDQVALSQKWLRQQSKDFYAEGFDALV
jgi:hypothetical protein